MDEWVKLPLGPIPASAAAQLFTLPGDDEAEKRPFMLRFVAQYNPTMSERVLAGAVASVDFVSAFTRASPTCPAEEVARIIETYLPLRLPRPRFHTFVLAATDDLGLLTAMEQHYGDDRAAVVRAVLQQVMSCEQAEPAPVSVPYVEGMAPRVIMEVPKAAETLHVCIASGGCKIMAAAAASEKAIVHLTADSQQEAAASGRAGVDVRVVPGSVLSVASEAPLMELYVDDLRGRVLDVACLPHLQHLTVLSLDVELFGASHQVDLAMFPPQLVTLQLTSTRQLLTRVTNTHRHQVLPFQNTLRSLVLYTRTLDPSCSFGACKLLHRVTMCGCEELQEVDKQFPECIDLTLCHSFGGTHFPTMKALANLVLYVAPHVCAILHQPALFHFSAIGCPQLAFEVDPSRYPQLTAERVCINQPPHRPELPPPTPTPTSFRAASRFNPLFARK